MVKHLKKGKIVFCSVKNTCRGGSVLVEAISNNKTRVKKYSFQIFDPKLLQRIMEDENIDWFLTDDNIVIENVEYLSE